MTKYSYLNLAIFLIIIATPVFSDIFGKPDAAFGKSSPKKDPVREIEKELAEKQQKIKMLDSKEKGLLERLADLEKEVSKRKQILGQYESEIKDGQERIQKLERDLSRIAEMLKQAKALMARRLVILYKYASRGYIKILADSEDFGQFRQRMKYVGVIIGHDHNMLQGLQVKEKEYLGEISAVREELLRQKKKQSEMTGRLSVLKKELDQSVISLMKVHQDKEFYETAVKKLELAAKNIKDTISKIEKVRPRKGVLPSNFAEMKGRLLPPVTGKVISAKDFSGSRRNEGNKGIFIESPQDSDVRAVYPGRVDFSGILKGYGQIVIINHGSRFFTISGHLSKRSKEKGDPVEAGEVIGQVRARPEYNGARLYFEIRKGSKNLDPLGWLGRKGKK